MGEKAGSGIRPLGFDYSYSMYYLCDPVYIIWLLYFLLKALTHFTHLYKAKKIETLVPWKKSYDKPRQHIKKQRHYCANKGLLSQNYGFSSSHV